MPPVEDGRMEIKMKRILLCIFLAICSLLFAGCAKQNKDSLENMNLQIVIDETGNEKIVIPDPTEMEKNKKVVLPYLESSNDIEELSMVDFSFCDLKNAKILGYDIGNMVDAQTSLIHVQHNFSDDFQDKVKISEAAEKQVLGNCLVLFVSVQEKSVDEEDDYIVVLDYINGKNIL